MKRFLRKKESGSLWAENGDLEILQSFFQTIDSVSTGNEEIKGNIKQKVLQKMNDEVLEPSEPIDVEDKLSWGQRLRSGLHGLKEKNRWKFGVPAVGAVGLVILLFVWLSLPGSDEGLLPGLSTASDTSQTIKDRIGIPSGRTGASAQGDNTQKQNETQIAAVDLEPDVAVTTPEVVSEADAVVEETGDEDASSVAGEEVQAPETEAFPSAISVADAKVGKTVDAVETPETTPEEEPLEGMVAFSGDEGVVAAAETEQDDPPLSKVIAQTVTNNLSVTVEVPFVSDSLAKLSGEVQQVNGYVVGVQQRGGDNRYAASYLEVEIPAAKLDEWCALLAAEGKILELRLQDNNLGDQARAAHTDNAIVSIRLIGK